MAAGPRAARALHPRLPPPLLPPLLLLLSLAMAVCASPCISRLEACADEFREAEETAAALSHTCDALLRYSECVRQNARMCRGDLVFHSTISILRGKIANKNCSAGSAAALRPSPPPPPPVSAHAPPHAARDDPKCHFKGRQEYRHCLLFGDPHLKTFFSEFQTCRVMGAWPLIDNPYLGVQVTNEPVRPHSPATATTKLTIVIRGHVHPCAQEKTYEATSEMSGLSTTFIDGTQRSSAPHEAIALHVVSPEHVEIHVRYLNAVLVVRQSGRWLAFSARLPVEVLVGAGQSDLQLCVRGCPAEEQLSAAAASGRGAALSHAAAWARCRDAAPAPAAPPAPPAADNATAAAPPAPIALTDEYLDWCIFDVMTTGDDEAEYFTAAAYRAQEDVLRLDPTSLRNRTAARPPAQGHAAGAGSSGARAPPAAAFAALLAVLCALAHATARAA